MPFPRRPFVHVGNDCDMRCYEGYAEVEVLLDTRQLLFQAHSFCLLMASDDIDTQEARSRLARSCCRQDFVGIHLFLSSANY